MSNLVYILCNLILFLGIFILESKETDENPNLQSYLPLLNDEQAASRNKRFQQMMQGGSPSDAAWPQPPKLKSKRIDVKSEIAILNTSYVCQSSWPEAGVSLGQVTAVSFDKDGNVVVFHRVNRIWGVDSFDHRNNYFTQRNNGPIHGKAVLAFEREHGHLVYDWGSNFFYMPHGLTIDHEDNVWVTDVALHQVFKFGPRGSNDKPLMTLGTAFTPGNNEKRFCKPTSVAVLGNGDFFIADGYCNARILKYSKTGEKILQWGQNTFSGVSFGVAPQNFFAIPHALTLVPDQELICAADRENGRIQCFYWANGTFHSQYHSPIIGDRLFSVDYTPAEGGQFVVVNGPPDQNNEVGGYVMDMKTKKVLSKFGPFDNPHDIAVTKDGKEIYVAELNPKRIYKFLHKSIAKTISMSEAKTANNLGPVYSLANKNARSNNSTAANTHIELTKDSSALTANLSGSAGDTDATTTTTTKHRRPSGTAILVASLMLLFAVCTFLLALMVARRRKRGNAAVSGVGQPSELVYRKLVASTQNVCDDCP